MFELKNVGCSYSNKLLFDPITTSFKNHDKILIQGVNGIGKTTLLRCMLGLNSIMSGEIRFDGKLIHNYQRFQLGQMIGYVHQQPSYQLFGMSVWDECTLFTKWRKQEIDDNVINKMLESLNLLHLKQQHPQLCSRGEQQRLSIAIALLQKPRFMLIDEPTTALDDRNVELLIDIINQNNDVGWIIVSHDCRLKSIKFNQIITLSKENQYEKP